MSDLARLPVTVRPEAIGDWDAIRALTTRAFAGLSFSDGTEPMVIDALRDAGALALSLVAVARERVVGHVAFSRVGPPENKDWFALGPVSVDPEVQRRGIGSQLIEAGLRSLRESGASGCVLLGSARYYQRFGFVNAPTFAPPEYPAQDFHALNLGGAHLIVPVEYHPAFSIAPNSSIQPTGSAGG